MQDSWADTPEGRAVNRARRAESRLQDALRQSATQCSKSAMEKLTKKKAAFESEVLENWGEPFHDFHGFEDSVNGWQYSSHDVNRIWLSWTKAWDVALQSN